MGDGVIVGVSRQMVREWVAKHGRLLEQAQAEGRLARVKLDLRDAVARSFPAPEHRALLLDVFDQELQALCDDLRLSSVTIQHQVERQKETGWGAYGLIALGGLSAGVVALGISGSIIVGLVVWIGGTALMTRMVTGSW